MKNIFAKGIIAGMLVFPIYSCEEAASILGNGDTASGLKSALSVGIDTAASRLHKKDGYLKDVAVKIGVPDEAATAFNAINSLSSTSAGKAVLSAVGSNINGSMEQTIDTLFNRAAEDAAPKSVGVFKDAITGMSINDAEGILFGADNAATEYLKTNTYTGLQSAFHPAITASLNTVNIAGVTATDAWKTFANYNNQLCDLINSTGGQAVMLGLQLADKSTYNKVCSIQPTTNDLSDYVTGKALDGLFTKVTDQEYQIRYNVNARVNDVLKRVFGRLDNK
ncbi:MAG: DUF4197 domain-containing protein [Bacteroidales bacterium]|nr:DUF4197 domain-containing protein [Candidatus Physcocola equi]